MLQKGLKLLFLISLFHIDIRVNAEEFSALPSQCWIQGGECLVQTSKKQVLDHGKSRFELTSESLLRRLSNETFNLLEGNLYVDVEGRAVEFEFPNGKLRLEDSSKVGVSRSSEGVRVQVLEGLASFQPLGANSEVLNIPKAYLYEFGWMQSDGKLEISLPRSLTLQEWTSLFYVFNRQLPPSEVKKKLELDLSGWMKAVHQASSLQSDLATRQIAAAEERARRYARAKAQKEREQRELRALFRKKNYLE